MRWKRSLSLSRWICLWLVGLLWLSSACWADGFDRGLLFRVEKSGIEPSYVFGTMHTDDPRVVQLPEPVKEAFVQSRAVALEIEMGAETMLASMAAMVLTDGRDLQGVIGKRLYSQVVSAAAKHGLPEMAIKHYKPWAVLTLLSMPPTTTGQFLDLVLYQDAITRGKKVKGLETVGEQIAVFESFSEADQIAMLKDVVEQQDNFDKMFRELTQIYLARDLAGMMQLNEKYAPSDTDLAQRFQERLIDKRNRLMVERMQPLLRSGSAFIAVGALHLPGEEGILSHLQQQGFQVSRHY